MAEAKLPACPVCHREPREWHCSDVEAWGIICSDESHRPEHDHEVYVIRPTRRQARAVWRRMAGGKR